MKGERSTNMKHSEYLIATHSYQYHKDNTAKPVNTKNSYIEYRDKDLQEKDQIRK